MALFSRRKKPTDAASEAEQTSQKAPLAGEPTVNGGDAVAAPDAPAVNISVSSYRGLGGAQPPTQPPAVGESPTSAQPAIGSRHAARAEAPQSTDSVSGLRDNALLAEALEAYGTRAEPTSNDLLNVTRQLLQGHVFLRVRGDARALLAEGKELPLAVVRSGENQFLLAYSTGTALQAGAKADQDPQTSAMGQPIANVIRHVMAGSFAGIILDQASAPARAVVPRELIERALKEGDPDLTVKNLLSQPRTAETPGAVAEALAIAPMWVAVGQLPQEDPEAKPRVGIAESQTPDGKRYLEVFSHPLEVLALGRGNQPMPFPVAKLATSLRDHDELTGIVVDPGGPWIRLERDALGPVLALAEAG